MKMKKIALLLTAVVAGVGMVGCVKNDEPVKQELTIKSDLSMTDVQKELRESGVLKESSFEQPAKEHWVFESVKDKIEDGFVSQAMINVRLQDVMLVKTTDMDAVEKAILKYKDESLRSFADGYGGEENITAVADSKLVKKDGYVYFIATKNADEVEKKLLEIIEK